jgi:hypothetical protein
MQPKHELSSLASPSPHKFKYFKVKFPVAEEDKNQKNQARADLKRTNS